MNAVLYYSNTNESYNIAKYFSSKLNYTIFDMRNITEYSYDNLVIVFPVYSQNIPSDVKMIIKNIIGKKIVLISTYGKMSFGRTLYEANKLIKGMVVGACYVPTKHAYLKKDSPFNEFCKLDSLLDCFNSNKEIVIPKTRKNIFANLLINKRAKIGVKIKKNKTCNNCVECGRKCLNIKLGKPNNKCIRCLKCVNNCPLNALDFNLNILMRMYLKKTKCNKLVIYK